MVQAKWGVGKCNPKFDLLKDYANNGIMKICIKTRIWLRSSQKDLLTFPEDVIDTIGHALGLAQNGEKFHTAKPLKGLGSGVLEVIEDYNTDTFRAVYTIRFEKAVYVLHCFQKKSTKAIATPKHEIELVEKRLKDAETHYKETFK